MSEVELDDNGEPILEHEAAKRWAPCTDTQLAWLSYNAAVVRAIYAAKPEGKRSHYEQAYLSGTLPAWSAERERIRLLKLSKRRPPE